MAKLKYLRRIFAVIAPDEMLLILCGVSSFSIIPSMASKQVDCTIGVRKGKTMAALCKLVKAKVTKRKLESPPAIPEHHSIEQFMQMLNDAEAPPTLPLPEPLVKPTEIVETYYIQDRNEWQKWRTEHVIPSASMLGSFYGFGYQSFNVEFKQLVQQKLPEPPSPMAKKMMDHGNNFEPSARIKFCDLIKDISTTFESEGNASYIVKLRRDDKKGKVMVTPDCVMLNKEGQRIIAEFKCPANGIVMRKKPLKTVADEHVTCYPYGRHGHVLQAATYALAFDCAEYYLFYYFTDGNEYYWVNLKYSLTEAMKDMVFDAIRACQQHIKVYKECGSVEYPKLKKSNTIQGYRAKMDFIMENSLVSCERGDIGQDLQKEAPDDSE